MRFGNESSRNRLGRGNVDMTSMVDVTFLLLIFFMVTASFHMQKSLAMPAERSDAGRAVEDVPPPDVRLHVDERGGFFVMTRDREFETPSKQQLIAILTEAVDKSDAKLLSVEVHESANLQSLVQALDAGVAAGLADIRVAQVDSSNTLSIH